MILDNFIKSGFNGLFVWLTVLLAGMTVWAGDQSLASPVVASVITLTADTAAPPSGALVVTDPVASPSGAPAKDSVVSTRRRSPQVTPAPLEPATVSGTPSLNSPISSATSPPSPAVKPTGWPKIQHSIYSNLIAEKRYLLILHGLKITLLISLLAAVFGTVLGAGICYLRMSSIAIFRVVAQGYIELMRGVPVLVMLMLFYYSFFASVRISAVAVAILVFGLNFAGYVAEIFRAAIQSVGHGQIEAGIALGFSRPKTFYYIVLPQSLAGILPVYKGEVISMLKMTSIVGYVAIHDLTSASNMIRSRTYDAFFPLVMVALLYLVLSGVLTMVLGRLEKRVNRYRIKREVR